MRFVEAPQRLDRNVKSAAAQGTEALAVLDEFAQFARRLGDPAGFVEARDFAVGPVEAEDAVEAIDFTAYARDRALRERGVGVPECQFRECAEYVALPVVELACRRGCAYSRHQHRQACCR